MSNLYRFGQFVLDPRKRTLSRADSPISLTPKAFDILLFLAQNPNRLVTKEELLQAVWGDTFVVEGNLTQHISHLRKALGDHSENDRLIVTIARKGYQFTEDVTVRETVNTARPAAREVLETEGEGLRTDASRGYDVAKIELANTPKPSRKNSVLASAIFFRAVAVGVLLAFVALCVWRYEVYRHRVTLAPTDTIVLADIDNQTSDPIFDDALNNALRYEFEQTPYLNLLGLDKTYSVMGQLNLPQGAKVTAAIARQICSKTNSKMVISDSIADAGNRYHLEIKALDCGSGATLAEEGTDIATRTDVVHELGQSAARLRRKLGEPAKSLGRFNQPLETATSASLEALQTGALGTKLFLAGNPQAALPFYQKGIELDPNLALTYEGIGAANGILGDFNLEKGAYTRAYQLRDRMTERDRLNTEYLYYGVVTGELEKAHSVLLQALQLFPRDVFFHVNLANALARLGQPESAAEVEDETARLEPSALYFSWAAAINTNASRFNQAKAWLAEAKASKFDSLQLSIQEYRLAFLEGNQDILDQVFEREMHGPNRADFLFQRAIVEAPRGHLDFADRLLQQGSKLDPELTSEVLVYSALQDAEAGRESQARNAEDQALQRKKLGSDREMVLALALARSGRAEEAARLADEVSQEAPLDTIVQKYLVPTVRAAVKLHQRDPRVAIDLLRESVQYDLAFSQSFNALYPAYIRGLAYLETGDGRLAAVEFQKLIDNPGLCWGYITGSLARLQLGRAEKLMGDNAAARESYEEFFEIWKDADSDIPIYQQAKAEYAKLRK